MKKSGKILLLTAAFSALSCALFVSKTKKVTKEQQPTIDQYVNRLNEFSLFEFDNIVEEFNSFLGMGFNPEDAFQLTIVKRVYI